MTEKNTNVRTFFFTLIIILAGAAIMVALTVSKQKPKQQQVPFAGVLVETITAKPESPVTQVVGHGTVAPRAQINLVPQVAGEVVWVHPDFVAGGEFRKGDELFKIEQADYILTVEQAQAQVATAEYALATTEANASVALQEWETMKRSIQKMQGEDTVIEKPDALVLHQPQLKQAEAQLASARATLELTKLRLSRTVVTAPFNCRVRLENVDIGQIVSTGMTAAVIYATDYVEIEIGVPVSELSWVSIPGSEAEIILHLNDSIHKWRGVVTRSLGFVDPQQRMATIVVRVDDPFKKKSAQGMELSVGSFVEVKIDGKILPNVIPVPRFAIRDNSTIWIASKDNMLEIKPITVARMSSESAYVSQGIQTGDAVVLTNISGAADGLKLRKMSDVQNSRKSKQSDKQTSKNGASK